MKKLAILFAVFTLIAAFSSVPKVKAMDVAQTINLSARGAECDMKGYISPAELALNYGDNVTLRFKNQQSTKLEVRGVPGGTFLIKGNDTVEKTFTATKSFTYTTWLEKQDCKKDEAKVTVSGGGFAKAAPWIGLFALAAIAGAFLAMRQHKPTDKIGRNTSNKA